MRDFSELLDQSIKHLKVRIAKCKKPRGGGKQCFERDQRPRPPLDKLINA